MDYERSASKSPLVDYVAPLIFPGAVVCDVGGASGRFLSTLESRTGHGIDATVLEIDEAYRDKLVDSRFRFLHASIVDNEIPDEAYDVVTARHVLHHLIGDDVEATLRLQRRGVEEMLRITKPGGYVAFLEQVNRVRLFSRLVYRASLFASRHRIHIGFFDTGTVVVSFLTPREISELVRSLPTSLVAEELYLRRPVPLRWRLTILMGSVQDALFLIQKQPSENFPG